MKTIQISDELFDKLISIAHEVNQQDNRATAKPYFFQVRQKKQVWSRNPQQYEHFAYLDPAGDYRTIETTVSQLKELCYDYGIDTPEGVDEWTRHQIGDFYEEHFEFEKASYTWQDEYSNAFLTEKACKQHIKANGHHYNRPADFLSHGFRNPDLETVFQFLDELLEEDKLQPQI